MLKSCNPRMGRSRPVIPILITSLLGVTLTGLAPTAASANDYGLCSTTLVELGLDATTVARACSNAWYPTLVSDCTVQVVNETGLAASEALSACSMDRRPDEMATCVTAIHQSAEVAASEVILDSCRLSLLPLRFSECVVGVSDATAMATEDAIFQCLSAAYRPRELAPTFLPYGTVEVLPAGSL